MNCLFKIFIISLIFLSSCQNREWNNPFDSECPKEIWTPSNFIAIQKGTTIELNWKQNINNISGFHIERKVGNMGWLYISLDKNSSSWLDLDITGGKVHEYRLTAEAGNNLSNSQILQITPIFPSTLSTSLASMVTSTTAVLGGTIISDGGASVTERGICYSTSQTPTTSNTKVTMGNGIGTFSNTCTGLKVDVTYYVRAYAINSQGIAYGNQVSFTAGGPGGAPGYGTITDIDGNVYNTITIGTQVWMVENLKVTRYNDGTLIPNISNINSWSILTTGAYCWYNNNSANKDIYGALYNWYVVSDSHNIAPKGWHIPSSNEWQILIDFLGGQDLAGGKMKEPGSIHWQIPNLGATNESGFNGLPGGARYAEYIAMGEWCLWWCKNEWDSSLGYEFGLTTWKADVIIGGNDKVAGLSIRCIKD